MKQLKKLEDVIEMCNIVFNFSNENDFEASPEEIEYYESLYKTYVHESLDVAIDNLFDFESEEDYNDHYDCIAINYNPNNLVYYFKNIFDEKEKK